MYGGSHKYGRGGGHGGSSGGRHGGANKRNSFPLSLPPQPQRHSSNTPAGRLSLGGGGAANRNRNAPPLTAAPAAAIDESFSLLGGEPLSFAATIRLAPDLVDEIKRLESQGGAAKIKFDPNPNNSLGNVIDVGGKEFRFTWSHEMGGLCDIYEERRSGEDGNGLLVESGCASRKLNVQRVLDDSTKDRVKRRSEEAEEKLKSRRAIVLDQCNPSAKSQIKALAAAEASPWKFKHKKDMQYKKKNFESSQGGPPKSVHRSGVSSIRASKGRHSTSPLPSSPNQSVSLASPSLRGNFTESQAIAEDTTPVQARTRENAASSEKDFTARASGRKQEPAARSDNQVAVTMDLQSLLISLLNENPKGMSIKALEKAVGDMAPNSRTFEPILRKIATYEPPGRYILKPGAELERLKSSDKASSPLDNHQKPYTTEDHHGPAPDTGFAGKSPAVDVEEQVPMNNKFEEEPNLVEKIDASQHFSDLFGDDEPHVNSERQAASHSDSGSDSDSDSSSSNSGSDSGSRSRSRSPAGTASGNASDSENDSSSNSKEESDMDIDILNDDDKEPNKLQDAGLGLSTKPVPWSMPEARIAQDGSFGDQDGYASEDVDIEKDFLDDNETVLATVPHDPAISTEKFKPVSPEHDQRQQYGVTDVLNDQKDVEDEFRQEHPDSSLKSKGKSKRGSNVIQSEENAEVGKRFKAGNMAQSLIPGYIGGSPPKSSPDTTNEGYHPSHNLQMPKQFNRDDNYNLGMQRGYNHLAPAKSAAELLQSGRRPARSHDIEGADKIVRNPQNWGVDGKYQEANAHKREGFLKQGYKGSKETQDEEGNSNEKVNGNSKGVGPDQKQLMRTEPHHKKQSEDAKRSHTIENSSRMQMGSLPKDKTDVNRSPVDRKRLQRELSDLELGELREPQPEEPVVKKQFDRISSFKHSETKLGTSASRNADLKGKTGNKPTINPGNLPSPDSRAGVQKNADSWSQRRSPEPCAEESIQPSQWAAQSQQQQSRVAPAEVSSLSNKGADVSKLRNNESVTNQGTDVEGYGETQKKPHINTQLEDSRQDAGSRKVKGNKSRKNTSAGGTDRRRDASLIEGRNHKRKKSESSSDETSSYSKYEKEEPELKGPIRSFSQYKEYVQEYRDKYESYCSLNKVLESYRSEFQKLGIDLDSAKGRDMDRYYNVLAQLRESYRQCGTRHRRLKKIFVILHEELKHLKQRIKDFAVEYARD